MDTLGEALGQPVFDYCERQSAAFWAEPMNALSNAAFLFAAGVTFLRWRERGGDDYPILALTVVTALVGAGSFIFHTVANRGAELLDVIPIAFFIYGYFLLGLRRFFGLRALAAGALTLFFAIGAYAVGETVHGFNGSGSYLPALVALAVFSALLWRSPAQPKSRKAARGLATAAALFSISLFFRTADRAICTAVPFGSHFMWHLLNALVLGLLLKTAIDHATPSKKA